MPSGQDFGDPTDPSRVTDPTLFDPTFFICIKISIRSFVAQKQCVILYQVLLSTVRCTQERTTVAYKVSTFISTAFVVLYVVFNEPRLVYERRCFAFVHKHTA